jgi:hypothetical protein
MIKTQTFSKRDGPGNIDKETTLFADGGVLEPEAPVELGSRALRTLD